MSGEPFDKIETLEGQQSENPGGFERLVERLALIARDGRGASTVERNPAKHSFDEWAILVEKDGIRAVLAELTKVGAEAVLSEEACEELAYEVYNDADDDVDCAVRTAQRVREVMVATVAPILAAKDAEIERLRAEAVPTEEQLAEEAARFAYDEYEPGWWDRATDGQRDRVTMAALYVIRGGDDRSVFGTQVRLYAKGTRRVGRKATSEIVTEAPATNTTSADD